MSRRRYELAWRAAAASCSALLLAPSLAWACPMCFTGGNSNTQAFVWGSLLLMFVPTAALGTLGYLAYKRIVAIDDGVDRSPKKPSVSAAGARAATEPALAPALGVAADARADGPGEVAVRPALRVLPPV